MSTNNFRYNPVYLHLLQSFQKTKTHLSISNLNNSFLTNNPQIFSSFLQKFIIKLQTTKKLTNLTLDLQSVKLAQENINEIYTLLFKQLHHIETFKIILCSMTSFQKEYFTLLLKALQNFRGLKTLQVTISRMPNDVSFKLGFHSMITKLKSSAPRLHNVKFIIGEGAHMNYEQYACYGLKNWGIQRLWALKSLSLQLPRIAFLNYKPRGKLDLSPLRRLRKLRSLEIIAIDLPNDFQGSVKKELAFDPKKILPHLKRFKWGVVKNSSGKLKWLELFGPEVASHWKGLQDFEMRFKMNCSELSEQEIEDTAECLSALKIDLKRFSQIFDTGKLTSDVANAFLVALSGPRLRKIEVLSLEFIAVQGLNNGFVAKLSEVIGNNMKEVRALRLRFDYHESKSSSFEKNLLFIVGYEGLRDKGLNDLGGSLCKGCERLELISLEFGYYSLISDKGVESLCESLRKIESLIKIRFRFRFCSQISKALVTSAGKKFGPQRDVKFALK